MTGAPHPGPNIAREAERLHGDGALAAGIVLDALRAIERATDPSLPQHAQLIPLYDGRGRNWSDVDLSVRAPDTQLIEQIFGGDLESLPAIANEISGVLEIQFGDTVLVLGGDLPVRRTDNSADLPFGWTHVLRQHPHLPNHRALKIPHHGSRNALTPVLLGNRDPARVWLLTPFNSSRLSHTDDEDGLDILLGHHQPVLQTALSTSRKLTAAFVQKAVTRETLGRATAAVTRSSFFKEDDTVVRSSTALEPLDPVGCVAFDRQGTLRGRWGARRRSKFGGPSSDALRPRAKSERRKNATGRTSITDGMSSARASRNSARDAAALPAESGPELRLRTRRSPQEVSAGKTFQIMITGAEP